ncbi:hypothetical protein GLE_4804 [Lysobacter enzymogenes]|uniref:Uncharacterized protein n=1 Tax=Lysobacter enzymogenes TaxID=69 RepID=A0A0S2DNT2_LYSEN|nr:hypothetical protein GLE_4804 [Lysobacter enzymogenes]
MDWTSRLPSPFPFPFPFPSSRRKPQPSRRRKPQPSFRRTPESILILLSRSPHAVRPRLFQKQQQNGFRLSPE